MELIQLKSVIDKFADKLKKDMNANVHVQTGALKDSIDLSLLWGDKNKGIDLRLLEYGTESHVWSDRKDPANRMEGLLKEFEQEIADAFAKDIASEIKDTIENK